MPNIPYIGVVFSFMGWLSLGSYHFLDDSEGNANVSVAIKSGSTVTQIAGINTPTSEETSIICGTEQSTKRGVRRLKRPTLQQQTATN